MNQSNPRSPILPRLQWIAFTLLLLLTPIQAQQPPAEFEYTRTLWRVPEGLPEDTVQALTPSSDGRLWIGTTGGLVRFDGSSMAVQTFPTQPATVSANSIFSITATHDGSLYAGTEGSGLLRFRNGTLKVFSAPDGLTDGFVRSVFEDTRGRIWVGTDGGLFTLHDDRLTRIDNTPQIAPLAVHSITEDTQHRIWVGGSRLITIEPDGRTTDHALRGAYSQTRVKRIVQTTDGTIWVGTVGGLERLRNGRFEIVPNLHATVRSLLQTTDGDLWIGTIGQGLFTLRGDTLTRVSRAGLLPSDTILSMLQDDQHQLWIGTQAGLVRLTRTPISVITLPESGDPDYETISGNSHGEVWVAAQRLYLIHNGAARPLQFPQLAGASVRNIFQARDGALWIGTDGSGAFRINGTATTHYTAPNALTNNFVRSFLEARDGSIWIATDEGVSHIAPTSTRKLTEADGLVYFSTRSLAEDRAGNLWIGTDRGLSCWRNGSFAQNEATRRLRDEKVWSILEDRTGTLWFGTRDHGLFRFRDGHMLQLTTAQGLAADSVYQLLQDHSGTFWITGPNSISSLAEADLEQPTLSPDKPLSVMVYDMPFGASGAQLYGGRQPSGYLAADGSVWFPTSKGAAHLLAPTAHTGARPHVYLGDILADGRATSPTPDFVVPAGTTRLSFAFSAVSLRSQTGVRFRYQLSSFDSTWTSAGANRVATYTNLRAGSYRFRVQAFDISDPATLSEAEVTFTQQPFFYQTWWFYALCALLLALVAWTIYQIRIGQIRNRFGAVLKERNRLAREMHDTVIQSCTGISALLEAIAITPATQPDTRQELLDYARDQARQTIDEARQAVWDMRHERESAVDLVAAIRTVTDQTTREFGTPIAFLHSSPQIPLSASIAHEILMTVREAVYNSVQHSGSASVLVEARHTRNDLVVTIQDHGRGFLPTPNPSDTGHYGILGMRERTQRIGGKFLLTSQPTLGTRIEINVKLRGNPTQNPTNSPAQLDWTDQDES
jgi:ligand-binding sensor domain-containing protein/signal transduction histidine kinase